MSRRGQRGQILVIFAGGLVALVAIAALVIDLASVYSTQQTEKTAADAAALAGAQDLQVPDSRAPGDPVAARTHALMTLAGRFGVATPALTGACNPHADMTDCLLDGTPYHIAMSTPSKTTGDPRSLQVSVTIPNFQLSLSRLLGQNGWNVGKTSVAVLGWSTQYAVITLQPPHPRNNGTDSNLNKDLVVSGNNTVLNVVRGDIGTNTSATTTNQGLITLASGYYIHHYDDLSALGSPTWTQTNGLPAGKQLTSLILDPQYMYPSFAGATTFTTQAAGLIPCTGSWYPTGDTRLPAGTVCYQPGIYNLGPTGNQTFSVASSATVYLKPGAYYFQSGLQVNGSLFGGLISNAPGVVLQFNESNTLNGNNAANFVLNTGAASCGDYDQTCKATPAIDFAGAPVKTNPGGLVLSIEVLRNNACFSGATPLDVASCEVSSGDATVNLAGSGSLKVAGVLYGPSDQMAIHGNSSQGGLVGQLLSWTVTYTGGSTLNQQYPDNAGNGVLHLDVACSGGNTPCTP